MSLGDVTKCNLDALTARVDYNELKHILRSHFKSKIEELHKTTDSYYNHDNSDYTPAFLCSVHGRKLEFIVEDIRITAELLYTIENILPFEDVNTKRRTLWV